MDTLRINGLKVSTRIGVHAWEQQINQTLLIDIIIPWEMQTCEDKLENTVDYDKLCQSVTEFIQNNSFQLIETVANQVAELIKNNYKLTQITVSVSKPNAIKNAANIQVTITR